VRSRFLPLDRSDGILISSSAGANGCRLLLLGSYWAEKTRVLRFAGDKILQLTEDDEFEESNDGSHAVIYQKCPRGGGKEATRVSLRIVDGKTGRIRSVEVESKFYEAWVEVGWHVLCTASPDAETLRNFHRSGAQVE
jgi:hypothetical protein